MTDVDAKNFFVRYLKFKVNVDRQNNSDDLRYRLTQEIQNTTTSGPESKTRFFPCLDTVK